MSFLGTSLARRLSHLFPLPYPKQQILDSLKYKTFVQNIFNSGTNKLYHVYRTENIVEKGENAGYHNFLLFQEYFLEPSFPSKEFATGSLA